MAVRFQVNPTQSKPTQRSEDKNDSSSKSRATRSADEIVKSLFPESSYSGSSKTGKSNKNQALSDLSQLNDLLTNVALPARESTIASTASKAASDAFSIDRLLALQTSSPTTVQSTLEKVLGKVSNKTAQVNNIINQGGDKSAALSLIEKILTSQTSAKPSSTGSILSKVLGAQSTSKATTTSKPVAATMDPMSMIIMMLMMKKRKST